MAKFSTKNIVLKCNKNKGKCFAYSQLRIKEKVIMENS